MKTTICIKNNKAYTLENAYNIELEKYQKEIWNWFVDNELNREILYDIIIRDEIECMQEIKNMFQEYLNEQINACIEEEYTITEIDI